MREAYVYGTSQWNGVNRFACIDCNFDVLKNEGTMVEHCKRHRHGLDQWAGTRTEDWVAEQKRHGPLNKAIMLGQICWNTRVASMEAASELVRESGRLTVLNCYGQVVSVDNGSKDGTAEALSEVLPARGGDMLMCSNYNLGISKARNMIIDRLLQSEKAFHFLLFTDGDIEVVPYSSYVMMRYLLCHPTLGVIGAYSSNYTAERRLALTRFLEIQESRVKDDIKVAWTQYGLFRADMFRDGIRFDEEGPMGEPGWGFEDDDFAFQMIEKGWKNKYFGGMRYLHRNIRSSWPNMEADGLNPEKIFFQRKEYLLSKWRKRGLDSSILRAVEGQQPPRRM